MARGRTSFRFERPRGAESERLSTACVSHTNREVVGRGSPVPGRVVRLADKARGSVAEGLPVRRRSTDRNGALPAAARAQRRTLALQQLEPRLALATAAWQAPPAPSSPPAADVTGPSVVAFSQPVVSGGKVAVTVTFTEPVTIRGVAAVPYVAGGQPRNLVAAANWPARVATFTDTLPAGAAGATPPVALTGDRIVTGLATRVVDRAGNAAISLARPARVTLSGRAVAENQPAGAVVGSLGAVDADGGRDAHRYTLVAGTGSGDNGSFRIVAGRLVTAERFDFEKRSVYSVRIRATDAGGLFAESAFRIDVTDVPEPVVTGRVVDGWQGAVSGARVFADADGDHVLDWVDTNRNGSWDRGEGEMWTTTTADGVYRAAFESPTDPLVATGGDAAATGNVTDRARGFLEAPAGSGVINPLTTLVAAATRAAPAGGLAGAQRLVATGLGLPAGFDFTTYDPVARNDLAVEKQAVVVANVLVTGQRLGRNEPEILQRFVAALSAGSSPLDLTDAAVVAGIVGSGASAGDPRMKRLAGDNVQALAAGAFAALFDIARMAQGEQGIVVDGAPASTVVWEYDLRHNPLGFWLPPVLGTLDGADSAAFAIDSARRVILREPANLAVKPTYHFSARLMTLPGHLRPFMYGSMPVTVRVVPAD